VYLTNTTTSDDFATEPQAFHKPAKKYCIIKMIQYTTDLSTLRPYKHNETTALTLLQLRHLLFQHELEAEWLESNTLSNEMLAHRLDPVETQRVQHGARTLHDNQDGDGEEEPDGEEDEDGENAGDAGHAEGVGEGHGPEDDRELLVSKRQRPETEVRGSVGDTVEAEFCKLVLEGVGCEIECRQKAYQWCG
jgi:hypothetical protein